MDLQLCHLIIALCHNLIHSWWTKLDTSTLTLAAHFHTGSDWKHFSHQWRLFCFWRDGISTQQTKSRAHTVWFLANGVSDTVECQLKLCNRVVCNTCMISCWWSDRTTQADQVKLGPDVDSVSEASLENRRRLTSPLPAFGSQTHHIIDKWLLNAGNTHTGLRTHHMGLPTVTMVISDTVESVWKGNKPLKLEYQLLDWLYILHIFKCSYSHDCEH